MGAISYKQVEDLRDAFQRHGVTYLFIGKTGAILHGFPDTTQDADVFVQKTMRNGDSAARALQELGFSSRPSRALRSDEGRTSCN